MSTEALQVVQSLGRSTSSGTGCSYYTTAAMCPRKARLDKEAVSDAGSPETIRRDAGTVFHQLAAWYHSNKDVRDLYALEVSDVNFEPAITEGRRMFEAYTKRFAPDAWGKPIGVELQLPNPEIAWHKRFIEQTVGVSPFTARLDMLTVINSSKAEELSTRFNLAIQPGTYVVDHKTKGRKDSDMHLQYANSVQFQAYMMAARALYENIRGTLVNVIVAHKNITDDSFCTVLVEPPTLEQGAQIRGFLRRAANLAETNAPNLAACFHYGACQHLISGKCSRL